MEPPPVVMEPPAKRVCAYKDRWEQRAEAKERAEKEKEKGSQDKYEEAWKQELNKVREKEKEKEEEESETAKDPITRELYKCYLENEEAHKQQEKDKEKGPLGWKGKLDPAGSWKALKIKPGYEGRVIGCAVMNSNVMIMGPGRPTVKDLLDAQRTLADAVHEILLHGGPE
jgi:hypothetical protein